ncbi:AsmA family protein [Pelomonas sp. CA6]|uniref:AsmA family protein n=1 Tax=Pelomonas sp. CA6 TaxID=2907999 RepID=UPI001F4C164E|nr:AsmA family protein [Pelomonas sp. CA6]MCH7344763.1 AsmA family protein [Pelomonas sp. CA6]
MERWLSERLDRPVRFEPPSGAPPGPDARPWRLRLLGSVRLRAQHLEIAAPAWAGRGPMVQLQGLELRLGYADLLAWRRGGVLRVERLRAEQLTLLLDRREDGGSSWSGLGMRQAGPAVGVLDDGPQFGLLSVREGRVSLDDRVLDLQAQARFALREGPDLPPPPGAGPPPALGLVAEAQGRYRGSPFTANLRTEGSALPLVQRGYAGPPVAARITLDAGQAGLRFEGRLHDLLGRQALDGAFWLRGESLAAAGRPLGVVLPSTPAFEMRGQLRRDGPRWSVAVAQARIGRSRLAGDFVFVRPEVGGGGEVLPRSVLSGQLRGRVLWLADLGPAIGAARPGEVRPRREPGRVLPDRPFDLPALQRMDADVQVALDRLESGIAGLQAAAPLRARVQLTQGVLRIAGLDARLAQGRLRGDMTLDGREVPAAWQAQLALRGVRLEQWIGALARRAQGPPYASGRLDLTLSLRGRGRSTAELLAGADGGAQLLWTRGQLSHLVVEAAGLDPVQALGLVLGGDRSLPVGCAVARLVLRRGQVRPELALIDTPDSTLSIDGSLSLASERLDLVARAHPKDFSPLTLRSPLHVEGMLGAPTVRLDRALLTRRLAPAAALALLHPLAGLLPLLDPGDPLMREELAQCRAEARRGGARAEPGVR